MEELSGSWRCMEKLSGSWCLALGVAKLEAGDEHKNHLGFDLQKSISAAVRCTQGSLKLGRLHTHTQYKPMILEAPRFELQILLFQLKPTS